MPENSPFQALGLSLGNGSHSLEVLVATHPTQPSLPTLRSTWKSRNAGRAAPLLLIVLYDNKAALCGPAGEDPPAYVDLDPGQVERICIEGLEQPDRHAALRSLRDSLPAIESELAGIRNEGFLATHELLTGVRNRADWDAAREKAHNLLSRGGADLLNGLGFIPERLDQVTSILRATDRKVALAVLLTQHESPEIQAERFSGSSPVSYALAIADRENLPYVIIQHGKKLRIYPTQLGVGVGRRGRTETYIECHTGLLRDAELPYLWLLFSGEALAPGGSLQQTLDASGRFSGDLAEKLRERIYQRVVPLLAQGIVQARDLNEPDAKDLSETYEMAMVLLFRLLFITYAEDKDLLPYKWNGLYQRRSLKTKAQELLELVRAEANFDTGDDLWNEVTRLFRAVDKGNREWGVPAYNGALFSKDPETSPVGALLNEITLPNTILGPALCDLLLVETPEGLGAVDFRSIGVREFGTIYEGLLESELSLADSDLTVDQKGVYRPCREGEQAIVRQGDIYLHNASGARKSTGSYFTKSFAVEHLLDQALEPALKDHIERLDQLNEDEAGDKFFDFRVADIAMGSGHFLVAVVDRIERALTGYLARRSLPKVIDELVALRNSAREALEQLADQVEIEDTQLLRRLIARRCLYGVDINPISVQLGKLAIWIHTFVPGLPLSFLSHNFACGNSLVGIGQLQEVKVKIEEQGLPLFPIDAEHLLGESAEPLHRLARIADATPMEVVKAQKIQKVVLEAVKPTEALFNIITSCLIEGEAFPFNMDEWDTLKTNIVESSEHIRAKKLLGNLQPFHFPIAFPEVFLRESAGFDVILGNPPWEKARVEEHEFWCRYVPGLRGVNQAKRESYYTQLYEERNDLVELLTLEKEKNNVLRKSLLRGPFPGMGTGDPDLYKAFSWRFWNLVNPDGGRMGVVLPRSALSLKGSTQFRVEIFQKANDVNITTLLNNKKWFFEDVHPQYTMGLIALEKRDVVRTNVFLRGPYLNFEDYKAGMGREPVITEGSTIMQWTDTASLPLLPNEKSIEVFLRMREFPSMNYNDGMAWRAKSYREIETSMRDKMDFSENCPDGYWPIYTGGTFDIWEPQIGSPYAWINPNIAIDHYQSKRLNGRRNRKSVFSEFPLDLVRDINSLPCLHPRIAFRDVTNRTNRRTVIAALVPGHTICTEVAPAILFPRGNFQDQAFLLGILSSLILDWYSRRFVESHVKPYNINFFPVPRPSSDCPLRSRIIELAGRLACPDERFADWAQEVGVVFGSLPPDEREDMIQELDAVVAHLYELNERHLVHIFETFHEGWNYQDRLEATLIHFRNWRTRL